MRPDNTKYRHYILDWKGVFALIIPFITITSLIGLALKFSLEILHKDFSSNMAFVLISYLLFLLPPIICFDYFILRKNGKQLNFNFSTKPLSTYLVIFPMMFGMMLISEYITSFVPTKGEFFGEFYNQLENQLRFLANDNFAIILNAVIFAPLLEEIIFRGIIQKGMINKGVNPIKAILISSFAFGIFHLNPWQFIGAVLMGFVLGFVYYMTKSLLMSILLHAFNNLVASIILIKFNSESFSDALHIADWQLFLVGIAMFSGFYYLFMKKYRVHYSE